MARARFRKRRKFIADLRKFRDNTEQEHIVLLRKIALQLLTLIVQKNPVDTGRSRGNWQVAVDTGAGDATVDGMGSVGAVTAAALSELSKIKFGSTVILYNNVEYIVRLEKGSSKQAPRGMVAISLQEVVSQFR